MSMVGRSRPLVGIIGLGRIAEKAYLPVLGVRDDVDLVLCTRSEEVLERFGRQYRISRRASSVDDLIPHGIQCAFVNTSTESHPVIVEQLLRAGIDVYVDKPLAYDIGSAERLVSLAREEGRLLSVGFNRRFAPMYGHLANVEEKSFVLMQKNRVGSTDVARRVVYDDFIHVVDTLRYLLPSEPEEMRVVPQIVDGMLRQVMVQFTSHTTLAIGLMNRESGTVEETVEVISVDQKSVVRDLDSITEHRDGTETRRHFGGWESVLHRRGFPQIVDAFLRAAASGMSSYPDSDDSLLTHRLCERIVQESEAAGARAWSP